MKYLVLQQVGLRVVGIMKQCSFNPKPYIPRLGDRVNPVLGRIGTINVALQKFESSVCLVTSVYILTNTVRRARKDTSLKANARRQ